MLRGPRPIWAYVVVLTTLGLALLALVTHDEPVLAEPGIPFLALAAAFIVCELLIVHFEFRRSAHSFSLGELPIVAGLLFCSVPTVLVAAILGSAVVFRIRRLALIKSAFNLAQLALSIQCAALVLHVVAVPAKEIGPAMWIGTIAGMQLAGVVSTMLIAGAISLSEGRMRLPDLRQMFGMDALVTVTNTSFAVIVAIVISENTLALPLLAIPAISVFGVYRAYMNERLRHEKLEFLYEANRTLTRSPEVAEALERLLETSLEAFRCEIAEIVLFGSDSGPALRTAMATGQQATPIEAVEADLAGALEQLVADGVAARTLNTPLASGRLADYFGQRGVSDAIVAILPGEHRAVGVILLANRLGVVREFSGEDLLLLEALANNASVALQYDRLEQAVHQLRDVKDRLHHQAFHDALTELPNRTLFLEEVRTTLKGGQTEAAVLFIDVDDFKGVNDSLGHSVGDALLVSIAGRLRECVRPGDVVARLGGDEFAVLLRRAQDAPAAAVGVAERIMRSFALPVTAADTVLTVHLSVGIATTAGGNVTDAQLIRNADVAMYQAKAAGKGRFEHFDPTMAEAIVERHALKEDLILAFERGELGVQYQPIIDLRTGRVVATEALARWDHPERGSVDPATFIAVAEATGLIEPVGRFVLERACEQTRIWTEAGAGADFRMHVNLSGVELRDTGVALQVADAVQKAGIDPGQLVLEVTEMKLLRDPVACAERFHDLRKVGVRIALDDFGTGHSSLSYLHSLPLDIIKIAKPFVSSLTDETGDASFARTIIQFASTLKLDVIAEGVEREDQLATLRELGCEFGQGFLIGTPLAPGAAVPTAHAQDLWPALWRPAA